MSDFKDIFFALNTYPKIDPEKLVFSYANEDGDIEHNLTWKNFSNLVDSMTGYLRTECDLQLGDRVLLVYPPSIDFAVAFVSCMRAGLVPVPVYPPNPRKFNSGMEAFLTIAHDSDAKIVLTNKQYENTRSRGGMTEMLAERGGRLNISLDWKITDDVKPGDYKPVHVKSVGPNDVALIQYTSGSTSAPKGVVITHGNLAHQIEFSKKALGLTYESRGVFWVPQYHDLGLIGGIMNGMAGNGHIILFSPFSFIKRPALWFDLIHKVRATHTVGPNFGFDLAVKKTTPEQRAQWDLSCLEVVLCGAEPVRANTVREFTKAFSVSGLNPEVFLPGYGLAEHTVAVTFNGGKIKRFSREMLERGGLVVEVGVDTAQAIELVSSGTCFGDVIVRIVNAESRTQCGENVVGEIWVDSPSKAKGYWKREKETCEEFNAEIEGDAGIGYLRTGDLGFIHQGELYICGRLKDMLIIAGRNIYPQDIEESVETLEHDILPVATAAFTVDIENNNTTEEKLVLLVDIRQRRSSEESLAALAYALQRAVLDDHQIPCYEIIIAPMGTILKTTSGKVRRQACRQLWLDGSLTEKAIYRLGGVLQSTPQSQENDVDVLDVKALGKEKVMQIIAAQLLNLPSADAIDLHVSLLDQGMGSLTAVEFCQQYEEITQQELSISDVFNYPAISTLCRYIDSANNETITLDGEISENPSEILTDLHGLRHYIQHNRHVSSGFRIADWSVRPATVEDSHEIYRLDQQEYGWLGEEATDDEPFIRYQITTLNSSSTPWFWLLEKQVKAEGEKPGEETSEVIGWYILQPTKKVPKDITSWANATDNGVFSRTFDPAGKNLYLVAGGVSRQYTKQAHRLMVLNAISLMAAYKMKTVSACLAMPGFSEAKAMLDIEPEEYLASTHSNGMPRDAFLAFFVELWPGNHTPMRLLRDGYPPDLRSGGHGVCVCVEMDNYNEIIASIFDKLVQQKDALFGVETRLPETKQVHMNAQSILEDVDG